jgi:hypothetical protein
MQCKRIQRRRMLRDRGVPTNLLVLRNQAERCGCQRRHVQSLANVASRIRRVAIVMMERCARNEVQQRKATYDRQRAACALVAEHDSNRSNRLHTPLYA